MKKAKGVIKLTRYKETIIPHMVFTLVGVFFATTEPNFSKLLIILIANVLSGTFSFMINDLEDWEDDYENPGKRHRNPISAGQISYRLGMVFTMLVCALSLLMFAFLGITVFLFGAASIIIGFFYSWKKVRLKSIPIVDLIVHLYFVLTFAVITGFFTFSDFNINVVLITAASVFLSLRAQMNNEVRDFESDRKVGLKNTAAVIGLSKAKLLNKISIFGGTILFGILILANINKFNPLVLIVSVAIGICLFVYTSYISGELKLFKNSYNFMPINILFILNLLVSMYI